MNDVIMRCLGLAKRYGETTALAGVDLDLERGAFLALLGPSGCGKTTTLRLIAGFERPDGGAIVLSGKVVADGRVYVTPEKRNVGMVFQDYALFPHLTVAQNVAFGLQKGKNNQRAQQVEAVLALMDLNGLGKRYPHELSGGQQQRVALARALAPRPSLILLDEPFSNLDADLRTQVRQEVRNILKDTGTTAILVTHDQEEVLGIADKVAVLNKGRVEQAGTPEEIYHRPITRFAADFVGRADFLPGRIVESGVETELGRWPLAEANLSTGTGVEVMFRPHDIGLVADEQANNVVGVRQFRGEENFYTVKLASGREVHSTLPAHATFKPGDRVRVVACFPDIVVFCGQKAISTGASSYGEAPNLHNAGAVPFRGALP